MYGYRNRSWNWLWYRSGIWYRVRTHFFLQIHIISIFHIITEILIFYPYIASSPPICAPTIQNFKRTTMLVIIIANHAHGMSSTICTFLSVPQVTAVINVKRFTNVHSHYDRMVFCQCFLYNGNLVGHITRKSIEQSRIVIYLIIGCLRIKVIGNIFCTEHIKRT